MTFWTTFGLMKKMQVFQPSLPPDHPIIPREKVGVLLINLGTPDATDFWSIRRYLKEFLSDRRVIDINPVFWKLLLNLVILNVRPSIAGKAYKEIWVEETDESPLRLHTRNQSEFLQAIMDKNGENLVIDWAMRYGNPSIASKLEMMRSEGCRRILLQLYIRNIALPPLPQRMIKPSRPCLKCVGNHPSGRRQLILMMTHTLRHWLSP